MPQYDPMGIMGQQPGLDPQMLMQALSGGQVAEPGMPGSPLAGPPEGVSPTFAPSGNMGKGEALMMALAATVADSGGGTIGQQAFSQLTSARKKAAFTDTLKARNSLKRAIDKAAKDGTEIDVSAPLHLINDRINNVNRLKGDASGSMAARQLLTADPIAALSAADDELESMEAQGLGKLPKSFYGEKQEHTTMLQNVLTALGPNATQEQIQGAMMQRQGLGASKDNKTTLQKDVQAALGPDSTPEQFQAEMKRQLEIGSASAGSQQKQINYLRDKSFAAQKDQRTIEAAKNKIDNLGNEMTPASSLSMIFSYMKILDPGSVVRESEYRTAQGAAAVPDQLLNFYEKVMAGTPLTPEQWEDFKTQAEKVYEGQMKASDESLGFILEQADMDGIKRERVIGTKRLQAFNERAATRGIPPGYVDNGDGTITDPKTGQTYERN